MKDTVKLSRYESGIAKVPESLMLNDEMADYKEALYGYLQLMSDYRNEIVFCPHFFARWLNKDASRSLVHSKIKKLIRWFEEIGLIECLMPRSCEKGFMRWNSSTLIRLKVDEYIPFDKNQNGEYGFVYCDELDKIMTYEEKNKGKKYVGNHSVIRVLSYLRLEISKQFRENGIEAYHDHYYKIAETLGLSENKFSKCINILRELGIIHTKIMHGVSGIGITRKGKTIFVNCYKRKVSNGIGYNGACGEVVFSGREYIDELIEKKEKVIYAERHKCDKP